MPRYGATEHWAKIEAHRLDGKAAAARLSRALPGRPLQRGTRQAGPQKYYGE